MKTNTSILWGSPVSVVFALVWLTLASCSEKLKLPTPSRESVYETAEFDPVVQIRDRNSGGPCTGTFISPYAIITASHCVANLSRRVVLQNHTFTGTAEVVRILSQPVPDINPHDVAILKLIGTQAHSYYRLGANIAEGDMVRLVGYGVFGSDTRPKKRTGTNVIFQHNSMLQLSFADPVALRGASNRAGGTEGDSGGPLLKLESNTFSVVGLIQSRDPRGSITYCVDLTRPDIRSFINSVSQAEQLDIPGL